jgi:CubicO group peptidase (beta-lactamase class C family)
MHRLYIFFFLLAAQTAMSQPPNPATTLPLSAHLDSFFQAQPNSRPGFALSIEKNGEVIYRNAAGLADLNTHTPLDSTTNFRMASVTKQFTAMGILLLERDGALTLDDPIGRWLPELPGTIGNRILVRHLLTHSSGLIDYESLIPPTQSRQVLDQDVLHLLATRDSTYFTPGTRFRYSNSGFCLLALIIERASHQPFATFIRERIFLPLHMHNSLVYEPGCNIPRRAMGYAKDSAGAVIPSDQSVTSATKGDGGVYTSLMDYSKWIRALQSGRLVPLPPMFRRLRFAITDTPGSYYYAAGWFIGGNSPVLLFHSGSTCGFANFVLQIPGDEWSITWFSNLADNTGPLTEILNILKRSGMGDLSPVLKPLELTR